MAKVELLAFSLLFVVFLCLYPLRRRITNPMLKGLIAALPLGFAGSVVLIWCTHILRVWSGFDARVNFAGAVAQGSPYVAFSQVSTPFAFAVFRVLALLGHGEFARFREALGWVNSASVLVLLACIGLAASRLWREEGRPADESVLSLTMMGMSMLIPLCRNMELGNHNIWVAGLVSVQLCLSCMYPKARWAAFWGGFALGIAYLLKPYLLPVLVFLFWRDLRRWLRGDGLPAATSGIITAGVLGLAGSLLVPGICVDTYIEFVTRVLPRITSSAHFMDHANNVSWFVVLPAQMRRSVSAVCLILVGIVAFFKAGKTGNRLPELSWYLIALPTSTFMWGDHLMGISPALLFLALVRDGVRALGYGALAFILVFCSSVFVVPGVACIILTGMWATEVFFPTGHLPEENAL